MDKNIVCLIMPPSTFLIDDRVFPNLGVLKVAAALESADINVEVLDLAGRPSPEKILQEYILANPHILTYGFSGTSPQMPLSFLLSRVVRQYNPHAKLIIGGSHATLVFAATKKSNSTRVQFALQQLLDHFDVIVTGDGERAVIEALEASKGTVVDADNRNSPLFIKANEMDSQPYPARHLIDLKSYHFYIDGVPATSLISQLGCPFACRFCGGRHSPSLRGSRCRTIGAVVKEIAWLHDTYGYTGFMFYDDELNIHSHFVPMLDMLTELQRERGVAFKLRGFVKSELLTDSQAEAMYKAGFRWILSGYESGSDKILTNINKSASRQQNSNCVAIAKKHGLKVKACMSLGHPGESESTISETADWLLDIRPNDFDISVISVYPGTEYHDMSIPHFSEKNVWVYSAPSGDKLYNKEVNYTKDADYYKGNPDSVNKSFVYTDYLDSTQLVTLRDNIDAKIRKKLGIVSPQVAASLDYEHSMGMTAPLKVNK